MRVLLRLMLIISMLSARALGKECTNVIVQSHSLRYQMSATKNEEWRGEMDSHHDHLNPTEESTWMDLFSRDLPGGDVAIEEFDWAMLYRSIRRSEGYSTDEGSFLREMSLHDVRLDPDSKHGRAQQTNLDYLLMLDVDRLVWSFRKQAGLPTPGNPYGGWESPNMELRGHFVGDLSLSLPPFLSAPTLTRLCLMSELFDASRRTLLERIG